MVTIWYNIYVVPVKDLIGVTFHVLFVSEERPDLIKGKERFLKTFYGVQAVYVRIIIESVGIYMLNIFKQADLLIVTNG